MKHRNRFFLALIGTVAAFAFCANAALADNIFFDPQTSELTYAANPNAVENKNRIEVRHAESVGFTSYTKIVYNWYTVGDAGVDTNVYKYCYIEDYKYWACPAKRVHVTGAKGNDLIEVDPAFDLPTVLEGGADEDTITGGGGPDEIWGACKASGSICYGYADTLSGGAGNDKLHGGDETPVFGIANDTLHGGPGTDMLDGGAGRDGLYGDDGVDYADYSRRTAPVEATLDGIDNDGEALEHDYVHADVEGLQGGSGNDRLYGNQISGNMLRGGPGNDVLTAYEGDDYLNGQEGSDVLDGGTGADTLFGGTDPASSCCSADTATYQWRSNALNVSLDAVRNDGEAGEGDFVGSDVENVLGGNGNDVLTGNTRGNYLFGGNGKDTLNGKGGGGSDGHPELVRPDQLDGSGGNDLLDGGPAGGPRDTIEGGEGTDKVTYAARTAGVAVSLDGSTTAGEDTVTNVENAEGGAGNDALIGNDGANWLFSGGGNDSLWGGGGNDVLHGGDGNDVAYGNEGHDIVAGDQGADTLSGGKDDDYISGHEGLDTVTYETYVVPVDVSLDGAYNDGAAGEGDNVLADVETIVGGTEADRLTGSAAPETLIGGGGADMLDGLAGSDRLEGGPKADVLHGGDDSDTLDGGDGDDQLAGGPGYDTLRGGADADVLSGGADGDTADYSSAGQAVTVDLAAGTTAGQGADTFSGVENVYGSSYADTLIGNAGPNSLSGFDGPDKIVGGDGNDHLYGAGGDDLLRGQTGNDELAGGPGIDTADYSTATAAVTVDLSTYTGGSTGADGSDWLTFVENVTGSPFGDSITGSAGANGLKGLGGGDSLFGLAGNDKLDGGDGTDSLDGGADTDSCSTGETLVACE